MADATEGRWWLDFTRQSPVNPAGNELILAAGIVTIAETGTPFGFYEAEPGLLTITLPMPSDSEGTWRMEAKLLLPDPASPSDALAGMLQSIDSSEKVFSNGPLSGGTLTLDSDALQEKSNGFLHDRTTARPHCDSPSAMFRLRPTLQHLYKPDYVAFMLVETLVKVVFNRLPRPCIAAIAATAIRAAINPYSIAVAARLFRAKCTIMRTMANSFECVHIVGVCL